MEACRHMQTGRRRFATVGDENLVGDENDEGIFGDSRLAREGRDFSARNGSKWATTRASDTYPSREKETSEAMEGERDREGTWRRISENTDNISLKWKFRRIFTSRVLSFAWSPTIPKSFMRTGVRRSRALKLSAEDAGGSIHSSCLERSIYRNGRKNRPSRPCLEHANKKLPLYAGKCTFRLPRMIVSRKTSRELFHHAFPPPLNPLQTRLSITIDTRIHTHTASYSRSLSFLPGARVSRSAVCFAARQSPLASPSISPYFPAGGLFTQFRPRGSAVNGKQQPRYIIPTCRTETEKDAASKLHALSTLAGSANWLRQRAANNNGGGDAFRPVRPSIHPLRTSAASSLRSRATLRLVVNAPQSYLSVSLALAFPPSVLYPLLRICMPVSRRLFLSVECELPTAAREKHVHGPSALSATRTTRQYVRHALKLNPFTPFFSLLQAVAVRAAIGALRWSLTLLECAPQCAQPRQVDRARVLAFLGFFLSSYFANRENRGRQENTGARAERARSRFNLLHQRTEIPRSPLSIFFSVLPPPSTPLLHYNSSRQGCTTLMAPLDGTTVKFAARRERIWQPIISYTYRYIWQKQKIDWLLHELCIFP